MAYPFINSTSYNRVLHTLAGAASPGTSGWRGNNMARLSCNAKYPNPLQMYGWDICFEINCTFYVCSSMLIGNLADWWKLARNPGWGGVNPSLRVSGYAPRFCPQFSASRRSFPHKFHHVYHFIQILLVPISKDPHFQHVDDLFAPQKLTKSIISFRSCWVPFLIKRTSFQIHGPQSRLHSGCWWPWGAKFSLSTRAWRY